MRYIPVLLLVLFTSCSLLDNDDVTPSFLDISNVTLAAEPNQGSSSHKIEDLWIAENFKIVGLHQVPSLIPILKDGTADLIFFGGIRRNGTNTDAIQYPFYEQIDLSLDLVAGETRDIDLEFKYRPDTKFAFIESFDNSNNFSFDEDGDPMTSFGTTNDEPFEGLRSGLGIVNAEHPILELATDASFTDLPKDGSAIYIEMDYRSNLTLNVGLLGSFGTTLQKAYFLFLKPTGDEWNKIYIEITNEILLSNLDFYKLAFGIEYNAQDAAGQDGYLYLDNVKLIHF